MTAILTALHNAYEEPRRWFHLTDSFPRTGGLYGMDTETEIRAKCAASALLFFGLGYRLIGMAQTPFAWHYYMQQCDCRMRVTITVEFED